MQDKNILEKAQALGLDTGSSDQTYYERLNVIKLQLGLNDINEEDINNKLDSLLKPQDHKENNEVNENDNVYYANREDVNNNDNDNVNVTNNNETVNKNRGYRNNKVNVGTIANNRMQNKLKGAMSRLSGLKKDNKDEPKEEKKEEQKENNNLKNVGKVAKAATANVDKITGKVAITGGKAIIHFLMANPMVLVALIAVLFLVLMIIILFAGSETSSNRRGLYGFSYYDGACDEVKIDGNIISIDEYVQGVIAGEVPAFDMETLKAFAIAARTFVIRQGTKVGSGNSCYYDATNVQQAYVPGNIIQKHIDAVEETRGLIITLNGEPITYYDASCVYTAEQAREVDPDGNFDDDYYYIRYADWTLHRPLFQKIDYEKMSAVPGQSFTIWANRSTARACTGNHGGGMSQNGSAYLELYENYDYKDIIDFYYDGEAEIKSIYAIQSNVTGNWTQIINASAYSSIQATIMKRPIREVLSRTEYENLNNSILENVLDVGVGTRDAIVVAATLPITYFAENKNYIMPYTLGGGHDGNTYGIDPSWGSSLSNGYSKGIDCSAWVALVYRNAGLIMTTRQSKDYKDLGHVTESGKGYVGKPGDLMWHSGHIMVIVGVDEANRLYYVSHAQGKDYGIVITPVSFDNAGKSKSDHIIDMDDYISTHKNENYETDFKNGVKAI